MSKELYDILQSMVDEESELRMGNDQVNKAMIRHWCESLEYSNPLYTDEAYARDSEYGGIIMPPTMVQAYCVPIMWPKKETPSQPFDKAMHLCAQYSYSAIVGISMDYEFLGPLHPGDDILYKIRFVSVSPEKTTKLGQGYFVTCKYSFSNQNGTPICNQYFTVLAYKPSGVTN